MYAIIFIIAAVLLIASISLHKSADKMDEKFANRPAIITNPSKDLFINQKYAIVKLLAFIQGASPQSAYSDEANEICQTVFSSLELSRKEVTRIIQHSMNQNPEKEVDRIMGALSEIRDAHFLSGLYQKCMRLAEISGQEEMIELTKHIFNEIKG